MIRSKYSLIGYMKQNPGAVLRIYRGGAPSQVHTGQFVLKVHGVAVTAAKLSGLLKEVSNDGKVTTYMLLEDEETKP